MHNRCLSQLKPAQGVFWLDYLGSLSFVPKHRQIFWIMLLGVNVIQKHYLPMVKSLQSR